MLSGVFSSSWNFSSGPAPKPLTLTTARICKQIWLEKNSVQGYLTKTIGVDKVDNLLF